MAWYAEMKRRKWHCIIEMNMIHIYRKILYDEWYNSLTDEQKELLEQRRKKQKEKDKENIQRAFERLHMMNQFVTQYIYDIYIVNICKYFH